MGIRILVIEELGRSFNELLGRLQESFVRLIVRLVQEAGTVGLSVADQGVGINDADIPHVFEPFGTGIVGPFMGDSPRDRPQFESE
ncbi:MAG TPA: hypothetical protein VKA15_21725 [Isosphaeraceae bacterium]|nr:hypothetical protein [Isosphaeraceae bacterium]